MQEKDRSIREANAQDGVLELSPNQLEAVSGGVHTPEQEAQLNDVLRQAKDARYSKQMVLNMASTFYPLMKNDYPGVTLQEVKDYINSNWDAI